MAALSPKVRSSPNLETIGNENLPAPNGAITQMGITLRPRANDMVRFNPRARKGRDKGMKGTRPHDIGFQSTRP